MTIKVTPDQVDNARLLMALDKADGRESDEWIVRLAQAKPAAPVGRAPALPDDPSSGPAFERRD